MKPTSLVIPNWNGAELLRAYLPSILAAAEQYPGAAEVLVVDDGSSDDSIAVLGREFPAVRVVVHPQNRGFGAACQSGIEAAKHPVVILLNSDVEVEADFVAPLLERFEHPETFAASPLILEPDGKPGDVTLSVPYFKRGKIRYRKISIEPLMEHGSTGLEPWLTFFPLGGAVAFDRDRFLGMGGFDELFEPFYYEDIDLGFRAWRRGWSCEVVPESRVMHQGSGTISRSFKKFRVLSIRKRNRVLFHIKNLTQGGHLRRFVLNHALRSFLSIFKLEFVALYATFIALSRVPWALRERTKEATQQVRTEDEVFRLIANRYEANLARIEATRQNAATADSGSEQKP